MSGILDTWALEEAVKKVSNDASYAKSWSRRIATEYAIFARESEKVWGPIELRPRISGDCPVCGKYRGNLSSHLAMHDEFRRDPDENDKP